MQNKNVFQMWAANSHLFYVCVLLSSSLDRYSNMVETKMKIILMWFVCKLCKKDLIISETFDY